MIQEIFEIAKSLKAQEGMIECKIKANKESIEILKTMKSESTDITFKTGFSYFKVKDFISFLEDQNEKFQKRIDEINKEFENL